MKRHYEAYHSSKYEKITGSNREFKINQLRSKIFDVPTFITKYTQEKKLNTIISYELSYIIAKILKPLSEGVFIKQCLIRTVKLYYDKNLNDF